MDRLAFSRTTSAALRYWNIGRQRYCRRWRDIETPVRLCRPGRQASRAHPRGKPGFSTFESGCGRETDSPLEGDGFEPSVPRKRERTFTTLPLDYNRRHGSSCPLADGGGRLRTIGPRSDRPWCRACRSVACEGEPERAPRFSAIFSARRAIPWSRGQIRFWRVLVCSAARQLPQAGGSSRRFLGSRKHTHDFTSHPFIEIIDRHEAAAPLECLPERRLALDPLGFGVNVREADFDVFRPVRHEAPPHDVQAALAGFGVVADDRAGIGRGNVPTRRDVGGGPMRRDREDEFDFTDIGGKTNAATHGANIASPGVGVKDRD